MPFFDNPTVLVIVLILVVIIAGAIILIGTGASDPEWSRRGDPDHPDR